MISPDTDCNRVAYWPEHPDHTERCTQPEGHGELGESCWLRDPELMRHKHRRPTHTFTDPFDVVPRGGRHRAPSPVLSAVGVSHDELRRRLVAAGGVR